ncbi:disease resistance protein RPM1 [Setaria italica]|uniref:disease resistance protein RPM1 n=1 Tax=Setaria italica TaxID=4555 RepID=UPI000BE4D23E|nr:disease resistance protein RPM1 [Setaria italica]
MAEAVVGVLISKLGVALAKEAATYGASLLCKEASALKGLFGEIHKAKGELESMKAYLRESEKFKDTNETTGIFVKKVRELAFRIEDVVDEFSYKLEDDKHGGFVAKMIKRIKNVKSWHYLAVELRYINTELEEATKRRDRYVIPEMQRQDRTGDHRAKPNNQISCFAREEDVVGIEYYAEELQRWLLAAWVTVSKSYQVEDLLINIAREFGISTVDGSNMEMRTVVEVIRNHLEGKKYILVLDDVWEQDVWISNVMPVFPANCTDRFVLTSRVYEVASLATNECSIQLEPLPDKSSYKLFCKLAFWNNGEKTCPLELRDLAAKFLQKCEGLPIAIACMGRLLSCKSPTYSAWENVYEELELQSCKSAIPGVDTILKVSFEDLPYELKNCFLYCAIFPEDYELKRKRLIRHWITAGFITGKENKTLEQVAEGYLSELVNRSLLQVTRKNVFEQVKCCRMHDVIRSVALDKAENECFGKVYGSSGTFSVDGTRRISILSKNNEPLSQSCTTHLRAILAFTSDVNVYLLKRILASSRLLSTLDLQGTHIKMLPNEVFGLFNLRFLGLRYTRIEILPDAAGRLQNLEVLDAYVRRLTHNIKALRQVNGIKVPRSIRRLNRLHALQNVKASLETLHDIAALTELRTFAVSDVKSEHSLNLSSAIMNMSHLAHLSVAASIEHEKMCFPKQSFPRLRILKILDAPQLYEVEIEEGALESLVQIVFSKCPEMKLLPPGIKYHYIHSYERY